MIQTPRGKNKARLLPSPTRSDIAKRYLVAIAVGATVGLFASFGGAQPGSQSYVPPDGFVPDSATATRVARAVLWPVYGKDIIDTEEPLRAKLVGDHWVVSGSLPKGANQGGAAYVEILKGDAKILRMIHSK